MKKSFLFFLLLLMIGIITTLVMVFRTIDIETAINEYEDRDYIDAIIILNDLIPESDYETKEKIYYYRTKAINKLASYLEKEFEEELKEVTLEKRDKNSFFEAKKEIDEELEEINKKIKGDLVLKIRRKKSQIVANGQFYQEFITQYRGSGLVEDLDYEELIKFSYGDPEILSRSLITFYKKHPNTNYLSQLVKIIFQLLQDGNIKLSADDTTIMNIIINYGKQFPSSPEFNKIYQCQGDNVNLRNSPGLEGAPVGKIKRDELVIQLEKSMDVQQIGNHRDYWYRITTLNGLRGWIFGKFLQNIDITRFTIDKTNEIWSLDDNFDKWTDSHTPGLWVHIDNAEHKTITFNEINNNRNLVVESKNNLSGLFSRINTHQAFRVTARSRYIAGEQFTLFAYVLGNKKSYTVQLKNEAVIVSGRTIPLHTSDWHDYTLYSEDGKFATLKIDGEVISSRITPEKADPFKLQGVYCAYSQAIKDIKAEIDYIKVK